MRYRSLTIGPALVLALAGLAGCDSTALVDDSATVDDYNARAIAYNDLRADVQSLPWSTAVDMPTVGTATYDGYATVLVDTPIDSAMVGDARITANFTTGGLDGTLNNFVGQINGGDYANYAGSLGLTNGRIGVASASALAADLNGTLSGGGDTLRIDGGVQGNFRSDGAINAAALTASETSGTDFVVNGRGYDGDVGIVARR